MRLFETPLTLAHQATLGHGILEPSIVEGVAVPFPGDLTQSEIEPAFPALQAGSLTFAPLRKPVYVHMCIQFSSVASVVSDSG